MKPFYLSVLVLLSCLFCFVSCCHTETLAEKKSILLLDTDAGLDDAAAILLAEKLNLHPAYVICTEGNTSADGVVRNVTILSKYLGRMAKTVKGCERHPEAVSDYFGKDGLANLSQQMMDELHLTENDCKAAMAYEELKEKILAQDSITYLAIAPLLTLATLIQDDAVKARIDQVYIMGGGIEEFNAEGGSEFNFHENPEAVQAVLSSGLDITLFPLDLTVKDGTLKLKQIEALEATGKYPESIEMLKFAYRLDTADGQSDAVILHDTLPILYLAYPEKFSVKEAKVTADSNGHLEVSEDGTAIHLVLQADPSLLYDCLKKAFGEDR